MRIKLFLVCLIILLSAGASFGQRRYKAHPDKAEVSLPMPASMFQFIDRILRPCSSGATPFVSAIAASTGDLQLTTCVGKSVTINGVPINVSGLGDVVGPASATDNAVARFNLATGKLIQNSVFIVDDSGNATTPGGLTTGNAGGTTGSIALSGATSGTVTVTTKAIAGTWTFKFPDTAGSANQVLTTDGAGIGSWTTPAASGLADPGSNGLVVRTALNVSTARTLTAGTGMSVTNGTGVAGNPTVTLADTAVTPGSYTFASLTVDQQGRLTSAASGTVTPPGANTQVIFNDSGAYGADAGMTYDKTADALTVVGQYFTTATITAGGTTGNRTINNSAGSVNFAAAATSLTVTPSKVTANSIVLCTVATNDTTLKAVQCVPGAGSFVMFANAAATAETRVNFWILNQ